MSKWEDGKTFSPEILRCVRLMKEYHLEAVDGQPHDDGMCALDDIEIWISQLTLVARAIATHGPPSEWPRSLKSLAGGQLVLSLLGVIGLLGEISTEPDESMKYSLKRMAEDAIERLDILQRENVETRVKDATETVIAEAERIVNGY